MLLLTMTTHNVNLTTNIRALSKINQIEQFVFVRKNQRQRRNYEDQYDLLLKSILVFLLISRQSSTQSLESVAMLFAQMSSHVFLSHFVRTTSTNSKRLTKQKKERFVDDSNLYFARIDKLKQILNQRCLTKALIQRNKML